MNYLLEAASIYDDIRQMIYENAQDAEYLAAVKAGDMDKAQRMIDRVAMRSGYNIGPLYHGTKFDITVFKPSKSGEYGAGIYFSVNPDTAKMFGLFKNDDNPLILIDAYIKIANPLKTSDRNVPRGKGVKRLRKMGYDGVIGSDAQDIKQFVIFDSAQAKSADPVTYDDQGNIIPLSQRFNPNNDDIRY
jgi:hypothetical protein